MTAWPNDELDKIGAADDLEIAPLRRESTLRNPATLWVVRHGDGVSIRFTQGGLCKWTATTAVPRRLAWILHGESC
jgi:hypothetical protein